MYEAQIKEMVDNKEKATLSDLQAVKVGDLVIVWSMRIYSIQTVTKVAKTQFSAKGIRFHKETGKALAVTVESVGAEAFPPMKLFPRGDGQKTYIDEAISFLQERDEIIKKHKISAFFRDLPYQTYNVDLLGDLYVAVKPILEARGIKNGI